MERFPGYTLDRIKAELDDDQVAALLLWMSKYPTPTVRMVDWKN